MITDFLAGLGAVVAAGFAIKVLDSIYKTFLRPARNLKELGKWAVITGATDGIGRAYAIALAKKGISIVLISRTESKLQEVKSEIEKNCKGVEVKYIVCDYSKFDKSEQEKMKKELQGLEIGILINNVGIGYRYPRFFDELPDEEVQQMLTLNIDSAVWMTRIVLPNMLERKSGAIVNMSSGSALYTMPLLAEYSAAKSFLEKFSRGLNAEYSSKGVTVQCQAPFYIATKLAKMRKSFTVPSPDEFAAMGVKWIGYPDSAVQPFWIHAVQGWVMKNTPESVLVPMVRDMHLNIRKRGLQKDARQAEEAAAAKTTKKE
ncbi:hypothetical protein ACA910_021711 [Epithemia clementina (nom. ined.)]